LPGLRRSGHRGSTIIPSRSLLAPQAQRFRTELPTEIANHDLPRAGFAQGKQRSGQAFSESGKRGSSVHAGGANHTAAGNPPKTSQIVIPLHQRGPIRLPRFRRSHAPDFLIAMLWRILSAVHWIASVVTEKSPPRIRTTKPMDLDNSTQNGGIGHDLGLQRAIYLIWVNLFCPPLAEKSSRYASKKKPRLPYCHLDYCIILNNAGCNRRQRPCSASHLFLFPSAASMIPMLKMYTPGHLRQSLWGDKLW